MPSAARVEHWHWHRSVSGKSAPPVCLPLVPVVLLMAKECKPVAPVAIGETGCRQKKPVKLAPIFLPQKRECGAPDDLKNKNKKRKTTAKGKPVPSPVRKTEVLLSSDDDTIIDPFDADTDTDSVSTPPASELVVGATREEESEFNMWAEKRRPNNTDEVVGHTHALQQLKLYLNNFSTCRNVQDQYEIEADEVANLKMGTEETTEAECAVISGKSGIGKTTVVYAAAGDLGMKVFELNASSRRSGKILMESLQEATQSHHLRGQSAAPASSIATFFQKKAVPVTQISSNSVILLDDVDMIEDSEEQDDGFWRSLNTFIRESKVPVVLTTTDFVADILEAKLTEIRLVALSLSRPPLSNLSKYLLNICSEELDDVIDVDSLENDCRIRKLIVLLDFDVRKCLHHLQFRGISFFDKPIESDPIVPFMELDRMRHALENDSLTRHLTSLNMCEDTHVSRMLFDCVPFRHSKYRFTAAADSNSDPIDVSLKERDWSEKYQQLCSRIHVLLNSEGSSPDSDLRLDLLPYVSLMCASESAKAAMEEPELHLQRTRRQSRKRFLHYFESVGLYIEPGDRSLCSTLYNSFCDAVPFYEDTPASLPESGQSPSSRLFLGNNCQDSDSSDSSDS